MISIENKSHIPSIPEISALIGNEVFDALHRYMEDTYHALVKVEYSGDKILLGWNIKYKKSGRTLCTVYPRAGHFPLLLVVGQKEKARAEALLPTLSEAFRKVYFETQEGMGQKWMLFDISAHTPLLDDILKIVKIRRERR